MVRRWSVLKRLPLIRLFMNAARTAIIHIRSTLGNYSLYLGKCWLGFYRCLLAGSSTGTPFSPLTRASPLLKRLHQGIGDSAQGFANFLLFCVFTKKVRSKYAGLFHRLFCFGRYLGMVFLESTTIEHHTLSFRQNFKVAVRAIAMAIEAQSSTMTTLTAPLCPECASTIPIPILRTPPCKATICRLGRCDGLVPYHPAVLIPVHATPPFELN